MFSALYSLSKSFYDILFGPKLENLHLQLKIISGFGFIQNPYKWESLKNSSSEEKFFLTSDSPILHIQIFITEIQSKKLYLRIKSFRNTVEPEEDDL